MDNDTEKRRLSPVAILSESGYLDLINGPPGLLIFVKLLNLASVFYLHKIS